MNSSPVTQKHCKYYTVVVQYTLREAIILEGIDLNSEISYKYASFRFFDPGEHHITRFCEDDVLLLVYKGVLNFSEDGVGYSVRSGEYHIQKSKSFQKGDIPSESPEYLYVHFSAAWSVTEPKLPKTGRFDPDFFLPKMRLLHESANSGQPLINQTALFLDILCQLRSREKKLTLAESVAEYLSQNFPSHVSLTQLSEKYHFSKSHIINAFRRAYGVTPMEYLNRCRLRRARLMLELTTDTAESIGLQCGFGDYSLFYKAFRAKTGVSPAAWRKNRSGFDGSAQL